MNASKLSAFPCAALLVLLATAPVARAQDFTFDFNGGVSAVVEVDNLSGNVVTLGNITVTGAALNGTFGMAILENFDPGTNTWSVEPSGGSTIQFDNQILSGNPILSNWGLGFSSSSTGSNPSTDPNPLYALNVWGNGDGSYSLFEGGNNHNLYAEYVGGALVSVSPIPEPSTFAAILGAACLGFAVIRRRRVLA